MSPLPPPPPPEKPYIEYSLLYIDRTRIYVKAVGYSLRGGFIVFHDRAGRQIFSVNSSLVGSVEIK